MWENAARRRIAPERAWDRARKPDKQRSIGRIDGLVALTMAAGLASRTEASRPSVYDTERMEGFMFV